MTTYATATVDPTKIKFRWEEQYVSEAHNRALGAMPAGVYRGFELGQSGAPDSTIVLKPAATQLDSVLISKAGASSSANEEPTFKVFLRETGNVSVATSGLFPNASGGAIVIFVVFVPEYAANAATTGEYRVLNAAGLATLAATKAYALIGSASIPNGATAFLASYATASASGGMAKDRPWDPVAADENDDSPPAGFASPYLTREAAISRNFGLQDWYEGGFRASRFGTNPSTLTKTGAGRSITKSRGPVTVVEAADVGIGAAKYGTAKPWGGFMADGESAATLRADWGFHGRTTKRGVPSAADHPRFGGVSLFDYAETGRGTITTLADPVAVTLSGTANIAPDGSQPSVTFGDPATFKSDIAQGDVVELTATDNANAGVGWYDVTIVSGSPAVITVKPRGQTFTSWAALGVSSGTARIWKRCFSGGSTPGPTSGFSAGAVVRGDPSTTALRVNAGEGGTAISVWSTPGPSTTNYASQKWRVTDQGTTIASGDAIVAGNLETTAGNVIVDAGNVSVTLGDVDILAGDLNVDAGSVNVTSGNVELDTGDVNILAGDLNVDAGGVVVALGNVDVPEGHVRGRLANVFKNNGNITTATVSVDIDEGNVQRWANVVGPGTVTLDFVNVPTEGTIDITIGHSGGYTLVWGTMNGAAVTHLHESGGGDQPLASGKDRWIGQVCQNLLFTPLIVWHVHRYA